MPTSAKLSIPYTCATFFTKKCLRMRDFCLGRGWYMKVFRHFLASLESYGFTHDISHLHLEFEVAFYEAACHFWPDVVLNACQFHLSQAW